MRQISNSETRIASDKCQKKTLSGLKQTEPLPTVHGRDFLAWRAQTIKAVVGVILVDVLYLCLKIAHFTD